jgi:hypothetical protein
MCLFHADFKHFLCREAKEFHQYRNDSSIIRAKVLSIMPGDAAQVTSD